MGNLKWYVWNWNKTKFDSGWIIILFKYQLYNWGKCNFWMWYRRHEERLLASPFSLFHGEKYIVNYCYAMKCSNFRIFSNTGVCLFVCVSDHLQINNQIIVINSHISNTCKKWYISLELSVWMVMTWICLSSMCNCPYKLLISNAS